jgi:hypothetical protein
MKLTSIEIPITPDSEEECPMPERNERPAKFSRYHVSIGNRYFNITDLHGQPFELPREIIRAASFITAYQESEGVVLKDRFTAELDELYGVGEERRDHLRSRAKGATFGQIDEAPMKKPPHGE